MQVTMTTMTMLALLSTAAAQTIPFADGATAVAQNIPFAEGDPNYLFIGNSYTANNNLVGVFANVTKDGIPEWKDLVNSRGRIKHGSRLPQHLAEANGEDGEGKGLHSLLVKNPEPWKWVILQDQSQTPAFYEWDSPGSNWRQSKDAAVELNRMIKDTGGQTMFFMTWGHRNGDRLNNQYMPDYPTMQAKIAEGYKRYHQAASTNSRPTYIAPVGLVFRTIYNDLLADDIIPEDEATLFGSLYNRDRTHPSVRGTYVAALTIYTTMTGNNPKDINWFPDEVDAATARILQDAVSRTILETRRTGEIDYPWNRAFPSGTSPPTPPSPGTPPPTESPTKRPTRAPTTDNGKGEITVTFVMDEYPEAISWTMMGEDGHVLHFQPFESSTAPGATITKTFSNLEPGTKYLFKVVDAEGDGICCENGAGAVTFTDDVQSSTILTIGASLQAYKEIDFEILPNGHARRTHQSSHYKPSTWEDLEDMISPDGDSSWPGAFPTQPLFSLMINMKVDDNPHELSWDLFRKNNRDWLKINSWTGNGVTHGSLDSTEFSGLQRGWHRLVVRDSAGNGVCCDSGRGYISVTGPLHQNEEGDMGLVWGNNGQFLGGEEIFFWMDTAGMISHISFTEV